MSHAPGPWATASPTARALGDESRDVGIVAHGKLIAETFWRVGQSEFADAKDNARLIAAAPELLSVLEDILLVSAPGMTTLLDHELDKARAIIARARGTK